MFYIGPDTDSTLSLWLVGPVQPVEQKFQILIFKLYIYKEIDDFKRKETKYTFKPFCITLSLEIRKIK